VPITNTNNKGKIMTESNKSGFKGELLDAYISVTSHKVGFKTPLSQVEAGYIYKVGDEDDDRGGSHNKVDDELNFS